MADLACHIIDCPRPGEWAVRFLPDPALLRGLLFCEEHAHDQDDAYPPEAYFTIKVVPHPDAPSVDLLATDRLLIEGGNPALAERMREVNCTCGHGPEPSEIHDEGCPYWDGTYPDATPCHSPDETVHPQSDATAALKAWVNEVGLTVPQVAAPMLIITRRDAAARADAWDEGAFYGIGWPAAQGDVLAAGNPYRASVTAGADRG